MVNYLDDDRVLNAFGYALPNSSMNETEVLQFWQTPDEFLDNETIATREYVRNQPIEQYNIPDILSRWSNYWRR